MLKCRPATPYRELFTWTEWLPIEAREARAMMMDDPRMQKLVLPSARKRMVYGDFARFLDH